MEQRYQAVLAVIGDGVPIVQVAERFGVSRQAIHRWLRWYEADGLGGLADRSHRPPRCAHQMDPAVEVWVLEAQRRNPDWGPRRPVHEAARAGAPQGESWSPRVEVPSGTGSLLTSADASAAWLVHSDRRGLLEPERVAG